MNWKMKFGRNWGRLGMKSKWTIKKISEIAEINPRESIKKGIVAKKIPMDVLQPFTRDVPSFQYEVFKGGTKFRNKDTIMARITPCLENGKIAQIGCLDPGEVGFGSTEYIVFRAREGTDPDFLYYLIRSPLVREPSIKSMVGSSGRQRVQTNVVADLQIAVPGIVEQKCIGDLLKVLDDKIQLNTKINKNLQAQAQAVFSHLFANNESVLPATISDIALNVTDGVHNTVHDDPDGKYLLLSCKNIKGGSLSIGTSERRINAKTFEKLRHRTKLAKGDVLISSVGTVGELLLLNTEPSNYEFQRSVAIVKPNLEIVSSAYLYESLIYQKAELINAAHGAVQQCLFISDIAGFPIGIPPREDLQRFDEIVIPMFNAITANEAESIRLSAIRDALLPKLMSGDIDVSNIDL